MSVPTKGVLPIVSVHGENNGVLTFPKVLNCQSSQFGMHGLDLKVAVDSWKHALIWDMSLCLGRYSWHVGSPPFWESDLMNTLIKY